MLRLVFGATILLAASGCATPPAIHSVKQPDVSQEQQRALLIGTWFGDAKTKDGGRRLQITERAPDGTYKVMFRIMEPSGRIWEQSEVGFWGASGGIYFTITRGWLDGQDFSAANPTDASLNDAYQILELTNARFRYRALPSGNTYSLSRVADSFEFPPQQND